LYKTIGSIFFLSGIWIKEGLLLAGFGVGLLGAGDKKKQNNKSSKKNKQTLIVRWNITAVWV